RWWRCSWRATRSKARGFLWRWAWSLRWRARRSARFGCPKRAPKAARRCGCWKQRARPNGGKPPGRRALLLLIDGERARSRRGQEKKDKAETDRLAATIDEREGASGEVSEKIGERHFARGDESGIAAEQAQQDQDAAHHFDDAGRSHRKRHQVEGMVRGARRHGKTDHFVQAVLQKQQAEHDAHDAFDL